MGRVPDQRPIRLVDARRTKATGLLVAGALTLVAVGVLAVAVFRPGGAEPRETPTDREPAMVAAAPAGRPGTTGEIRDIVQSSAEGRIELFDATGRIAQVLSYDTFEPLEASRFRVAGPKAHIFMTDGRMVEVRAASAQFVQRRARQEPESGWFRGGVEIRLFDRPLDRAVPADADAAIAADRGPALVEVTTQSIDFDLASGEVRTTDPVSLTADMGADAVSFAGQGLTMLLSEKDRRLLFLKIETGDHLRFTPGAGKRAVSERAAPPVAVGEGASGAAPGAEVVAPREDMYRVDFAGPVKIAAGSSVVDADVLEVWARLLGGSLAPDAVLPILPVADAPVVADQSAGGGSAQPNAGQRDPVTLTWAGALTLRPLATRPSELGADDVFVRFSAPKRGIVRFDDESFRAHAEAATIEYGLRTRVLALSGLGPRGAIVRMQDAGEAHTSRIEANLGTGVASFPGPGQLGAIGKALAQGQTANDGARDISWRGRADIGLARSGDGKTLTLRSASFTDDVRAREGAMLLTGAALRATFEEGERGRPLITGVRVEGDAVADAAGDGRASADRLDVAFEPSADRRRANPTVATAMGNVRAQREGSSIEAELVETTFAPDESGRTRVAALSADLGVFVRTGEAPDFIEARADRLRARPGEELVELLGAASIAKGPDTLRAESMRLVGGTVRTATVFGAGSAEHVGVAGDGLLAVDRLVVEWTDSMTFDDATGRAECAGNVLAVGTHGPLERHEAKGARLAINLTPGPASEAPAEPGAKPAARELLSIALLGKSEFEEGGDKARIESRRFVEDPAGENGLRLEGLVFLDADRIEGDAATQTLSVPGAGRLLLEDRRATPGADAPKSGGTPVAGGTTLLEWGDTMSFSHPNRRGDARGKVRLRHLPSGASEAVELECERLAATLADAAEELREADAQGAVYARRGARQLTGDRLLYKFANGARTAEVTAAPGNVVTVFDEGSGQASAAKSITWDIDRDRVKATESSPIVAPR